MQSRWTPCIQHGPRCDRLFTPLGRERGKLRLAVSNIIINKTVATRRKNTIKAGNPANPVYKRWVLFQRERGRRSVGASERASRCGQVAIIRGLYHVRLAMGLYTQWATCGPSTRPAVRHNRTPVLVRSCTDNLLRSVSAVRTFQSHHAILLVPH